MHYYIRNEANEIHNKKTKTNPTVHFSSEFRTHTLVKHFEWIKGEFESSNRWR